MSTHEPDIAVTERPDDRRYVITVDGADAGFAGYVDRAGRRLFVHTEIDPAFEGQGLGSRLVSGALEDVRHRGVHIVPLCPFVATWIDRHPDHADLVDQELLDRLDSS